MSSAFVPSHIEQNANELTGFLDTGVNWLFVNKDSSEIVIVHENTICGWDDELKVVKVMTTEVDDMELEYLSFVKIVLP